ncbi:sigma-70 family RNA polymerase sigma factor [Acetivibrio cellulolyticus]|uniref:sigma-70 family RNA polymerase sigma factor n=1 Tax=Acetivibrio cellulolyticus TaxID=35830 RepID=UPI0001E2BD5A|nr:sigma-70 family RNA polymerase sigma factor [Acetivibrio cellulolyticus]
MDCKLVFTDKYILDILDKYSDIVFRTAFMYLKNRPDAEDATQEIFIKLFRINPSFSSDNHIKSWLITVTSNHCKDMLKSIWRKKVSLLDEISLPIQDDYKREVVNQVLSLPVKYRNVIYLYYYEGYSSSEIAALLSEKEPTIRIRLKRGREILKTKLTGGFDDEEE